MKHWLLLLMVAGPVWAAPPTPPLPPYTAADLGDPDAPFYMKAVQGGMAEVEGGLLAQQRSQNPQVREFAAMVVKDHNAANLQLRELGAANRLDLPTTLSGASAAKKAQLTGLSGDDFDRAYVEWQILAHKEAIELFRTESESGDDKDARQFAIDTLPTLHSHLVKLFAMPMIPPTPTPAAATAAPTSVPPAPPAASPVQASPVQASPAQAAPVQAPI